MALEPPDDHFYVVHHPCNNFDNSKQYNVTPQPHVFESVSLEKHLHNCKIHATMGLFPDWCVAQPIKTKTRWKQTWLAPG